LTPGARPRALGRSDARTCRCARKLHDQSIRPHLACEPDWQVSMVVISQTHVIGSRCREVQIHASAHTAIVVGFENRQRAAGTRRVHQRDHARTRAGTADTC
jgi:hypothetical protein